MTPIYSLPMLRQLSMVISWLFHPILVPTMGLLYLCWCNPFRYVPYGSKEFVLLTGVVAANSIFFPLLIIGIFRGLNIIHSIQMKEKAERVFPFMIIIFFFFWTYLVLSRFDLFPIPRELSMILLGTTFATVIAFVINVMWIKISLHAIGAGGLVAIVLFSSLVSIFPVSLYLMGTILLAGLIGSARLLLEAHEQEEIYWGYFLGFFGTIIPVFYSLGH